MQILTNCFQAVSAWQIYIHPEKTKMRDRRNLSVIDKSLNGPVLKGQNLNYKAKVNDISKGSN